MKAKHIFLILILFFCGVSLNAQNQALDFLKAKPHDGDPNIEETISWLSKNWDFKKTKVQFKNQITTGHCISSYNSSVDALNYNTSYNILNLEYDICCGSVSMCLCCSHNTHIIYSIFMSNVKPEKMKIENDIMTIYGKNLGYWFKPSVDRLYEGCESKSKGIQTEVTEFGFIGDSISFMFGTNYNNFRAMEHLVNKTTSYNKTYDHGACLTDRSRVKLKYDKFETINKLKIGDSISSYSFQNKQYFQTTITGIDSVYHNNLVELHYENDTITCTDDHPFFIENKGWCSLNPEKTMRNYSNYPKVNLLEKGDSFLSSFGSGITTIKLEDIKFLTKGEMTYTITGLKKGNTYFANGILTGIETVENPF